MNLMDIHFLLSARCRRTLALVAMACAASACSPNDPRAPTPENLSRALDEALASRGDICLAMFDWPIDLTEAEAGAGSRHAVQLPVLEKLGIVRSTIVPARESKENPDGAVKRFELTDAGRQFYRPHAYTARNGEQHASDFCVAHLAREKIVGIQVDQRDAQHPQAVVSYTYRIAPAPWMKDADAQRVFPMVARVIQGAGGGLQLRQGFVLGDKGWVAQVGPV
jgi:hypothetical protein